MKKLLLSAAFVCAAIIGANAQTLLDQNFNSYSGTNTWPDANWKQHNLDGKTPDPALGTWVSAFTSTSPWGLLLFQSDPNNSFAASVSAFTVPGQANRWLVSPQIDLSSYTTGSVILTFKTQSGGTTTAGLDSYKLYVSTTGTAVADFGTSVVHQESGASSGAWTTQTVNLSSYLGQKIYLGWQHDSNDKVLLLLDDIKVVYDASGSSADFFTENFTIYPNPVADVLNIESKNGLTAGEIKITDMTGKVVKTQKDAASVNVSDLAAGTYIIDITTNEGKATSKFIKK